MTARSDTPQAGSGPGLVRWSVLVVDETGRELVAEHPERVLPTASVGKVLLLIEAARAMADGSLDPGELLARGDDLVADSGVWHTLAVPALHAADCAALVGAVSDNLATNVLLRRVGLPAVDELRVSLALEHTRLLDEVRDHRDAAAHPWTLSTGSARELVALVGRLADSGADPVLSEEAKSEVREWLSGNVDHSMVLSPLALDPLAHRTRDLIDGPVAACWSKTGTDDGTRVDVGHVAGRHGRSVSYAALAHWDPAAAAGVATTNEVMARMRELGQLVRRHLADDRPAPD